jgi:hypothetical protein
LHRTRAQIINRGGETIAPGEVEEALLAALPGTIAEALVFSAPHDVLQEVPAAVLVLRGPPARGGGEGSDGTIEAIPFDMATLYAVLAPLLPPSKWPHCVVLVRQLPRTRVGKLARVGLAVRLGLPLPLTDTTPLARRMLRSSGVDGEPATEAVALAMVGAAGSDGEGEEEAAAVQAAVAAAMADLLGETAPVKLADDFFACGGRRVAAASK